MNAKYTFGPMDTTFSFGADLHGGMSQILRPELETLFGFKIECDPSLPPNTVEIRGTKDGIPYKKRFVLK